MGVYLQDQIRFDNWVFLAGGRYDQYDYQESGTKYGSAATTKIDQSQLSGRIGVLYQLDNGVSPFLNYAQSFEPVSGSDKDGNPFDTSTADQWEAGLKFQNSQLNASVTAFQIEKSNVKTSDPDGGTYDQIQVGEVRSRGLELELQQAITSAISMTTAITIQDVEVTKDNSGNEGNTPIWTPEKQVSTWLSYQPSKGDLAGASFGAGVRYVGEMQVDAANSGTVPSYTLVDVSAGYDLAQLSSDWQGASVQFSVSNLFDKTYYTCYDTSNCWFGAERSFELKGRYEF